MADSPTTPAGKDPGARSPFAGCVIFIIAVLVMVFLIGFSVLTLFRQFNEIAKFTAEKPAPVAITPIEGQEARLNELAERVEKFRQQLADGAQTSLALSADDLNLAIAGFDAFQELRGTFRVTEIQGETLRAEISFQLNGKPRFTKEGEQGIVASDSRYLNGTLVAKPQLGLKEVVLHLDSIEVPGKKVAPEFTDQMSPYRITERYMKDTAIGPAMAKLTRVGIVDGKVVLSRNPGENPAANISNEQVDSASIRFFKALGIAACVFLGLVAIIILIGTRAKAKKSAQ